MQKVQQQEATNLNSDIAIIIVAVFTILNFVLMIIRVWIEWRALRAENNE